MVLTLIGGAHDDVVTDSDEATHRRDELVRKLVHG
jgi:hypothetical protein